MASTQDEKFATLKLARRIWAIAAIHGESDRLKRLHEEIVRRFAPGDRLVYLGNYLGRGDHIIDTVDELLWFRQVTMYQPGMEPWDIVYLRGSQEEMLHKLLQIQFATDPAAVFEWMLTQGLDATLKAYGMRADEARARFREGPLAITRWTGSLRAAIQDQPGHFELLTSLRRAAYTEGGELLFVHAGIDQHRPLTEQGDTFWWGSGYFAEIAEAYQGFTAVVRGYDRDRQGPVRGAHAVTIDGGCGFGGTLNAGCFDLKGRIVEWLEA
jgi:serine/threonine protein phosphatase 1